MADQQRLLREAFVAHGGEEIDTQGDSFFVAFRNASDAVAAAVSIQHALVDHAWPDGAGVRVRIGIHTGEAAAAGERYVGFSVHRAADLRSAGVGASTIRLAMAVLSAICRDAVERGEMHTNPVSAVKKVSARRSRIVDCLPPSKVEALRDQMPTAQDALLVSVLAYAGLRPGEAVALTWGDVGERTIRVNKALSLGEEKETKTRRDRTVRLLGPLAEDLRAARVALGRIPDASERIFLRQSDSGDWTESVYRNWRRRTFKVAAKEAGLHESTRPYDLRHSFCSLLIAEGASVVEVAAQAGHAPTMTLNTYCHVMDELVGAERGDPEAAIREARAARVRQRQADAREIAQETAKVGASPT